MSWERAPGINRYRLQVSKDEQFTDLVFDSAIEGLEYIVSDLPPGSYLWRVAPAAAETGTFSKPQKVEIKSASKVESRAGSTATATAGGTRTSSVTPASNIVWFTATGNIPRPVAFYLRDQSVPDIVGVNSEGMVYALDGTNGVSLWSSRFRPNAKRDEPTGNGGAQPFQPVAFGASGGLENVLVAVEGGVWAREGATGKVLWRATLPGRAASAVVGDLNGDGTMEVAVFQDNPTGLSILDASTGKTLAQTNLDSALMGAPAAFASKTEPGLLLALAGGTLDVRNAKGERVRSTKLDVQFTTPPLIVEAQQGTLAMLGTDRGLIAVDVNTLKPLWRVATEGDAPRGQLAAADMDNDGSPEVVMITRRGRTVVVNTANGKIKWYANIPNRAGTVTVTDLNKDGAPDVFIAADSSSMTGHDGRSGALIFGDEKGTINTTGNAEDQGATYQTCAYIGSRTGNASAPLVVCNDPEGRGLRAVGAPSSSK
ncbi:MAG TPA: PQQ-binding-like beta-propeller repeat protein [Pyrinomonadaceae bacterium]